MRDSAKTAPSSVRVSGPASSTPGAISVAVHDLRGGPRPGFRVDRQPLPADAAHHGVRPQPAAELGGRQRADDVAAAADAEHERAGCAPHGVVERAVGLVQAIAQATEAAAARTLASRTTASMPAAARSNSSSAITGVPSNGRSRSISTQDLQPSYSGRTRTVTGRWIL